jgi:WD40 repeat protein
VWETTAALPREQMKASIESRNPITHLLFSENGGLCAACDRESIFLWDGKGAKKGRIDHPETQKLAFSPNGEVIASVSRKGTVKLWEIGGNGGVAEFQAHQDVVVDLAFFSDGKRLVTASWDRTVKIWDSRTRKLMSTLQGQLGDPSVVAVAPDGSRVAVATTDGTVTLWIPDRVQPVPVAMLHSYSPYLTAGGFLPDGNTIAFSSLGELLIRRAPSFEEVAAADKRLE